MQSAHDRFNTFPERRNECTSLYISKDSLDSFHKTQFLIHYLILIRNLMPY